MSRPPSQHTSPRASPRQQSRRRRSDAESPQPAVAPLDLLSGLSHVEDPAAATPVSIHTAPQQQQLQIQTPQSSTNSPALQSHSPGPTRVELPHLRTESESNPVTPITTPVITGPVSTSAASTPLARPPMHPASAVQARSSQQTFASIRSPPLTSATAINVRQPPLMMQPIQPIPAVAHFRSASSADTEHLAIPVPRPRSPRQSSMHSSPPSSHSTPARYRQLPMARAVSNPAQIDRVQMARHDSSGDPVPPSRYRRSGGAGGNDDQSHRLHAQSMDWNPPPSVASSTPNRRKDSSASNGSRGAGGAGSSALEMEVISPSGHVDGHGDAAATDPSMSYMNELSASFLDRVPLSMRNGTGPHAGLISSSILMSPMLRHQTHQRQRSRGNNRRRGSSVFSPEPPGPAAGAPSINASQVHPQQPQTSRSRRGSQSHMPIDPSIAAYRKMSLSEMADAARAVKQQLSRQGVSPLAGAQRPLLGGGGAGVGLNPVGSGAAPIVSHSRENSTVISPSGVVVSGGPAAIVTANGKTAIDPVAMSNALARRASESSILKDPASSVDSIKIAIASGDAEADAAALDDDPSMFPSAAARDSTSPPVLSPDPFLDDGLAPLAAPLSGSGTGAVSAAGEDFSMDGDGHGELPARPSMASLAPPSLMPDSHHSHHHSQFHQSQPHQAAHPRSHSIDEDDSGRLVNLTGFEAHEQDFSLYDGSWDPADPAASERAGASPKKARATTIYGDDVLGHSAASPGARNAHSLEADLGADYVRSKDEDRLIEIYLEETGAALFSCGLPLHVVEFYLVLAAHRLHVDISIVAISTSFWITFAPSSVAHMVLAPKPGLSLSKMVDICAVSERILHGLVAPVEGLAQLQVVMRRDSLYPSWWTVPALGLVCFCYAPLFSCDWVGSALAGVVGLLIGLLEMYSANHAHVARGHDLLAGLLAGVLAMVCHVYIAHINMLGSILAGIVWCLPGLRITLAMLDLSTGNPVTGTAKFMSALIIAVNLGIGITAGLSVGQFITGFDSDTAVGQEARFAQTPEWYLPICIIVSAFPSCVLLDAHMTHFPQYIAGSALAFYLSNYASQYIGQAFGSWVAAAGVGVMANLYGRFTQYPAIELSLFAILMLVPGSIGVRSVLASDSLSTIGFLTKMFTIAIALVTGLFTANVICPPLRAL